MLDPVFIVAFTGHRPGEGEGRSAAELEEARPLIETALRDLVGRAELHGGLVEFYASAAEGADTIACETAHAMGLPVHVILPMPEEQFAEDFDRSSEAWQRSKAVIDRATRPGDGGSLRVARGAHIRPECYSDTNLQMLDAADALIALCNSGDTGKQGGSATLIAQARALKIPLVVIDPALRRTETEGLDQFANPEDPRSGLKVFATLARRARDGSGAATLEGVQKGLSAAANQSSRWYRGALTLSIVCHGIAALVAGAAISFKGSLEAHLGSAGLAGLAGFELVLVCAALGLMLWHARRGTQHTWLECRFATEVLRGVTATAGILDPLYPQVKRHLPAWRRLALTGMLGALRQRAAEEGLTEMKARYLRDRIAHQERYFQDELRRAAPLATLFSRTASVTAFGAVAVVFVALLYKLAFFGHADSASTPFLPALVFYFLPVALPLVAGMANSLHTALDVGRRKVRFVGMSENLATVRAWIEVVDTLSHLRRAVARAEEILLDEQIEWLAVAEGGQGH